MQLRPAGEPAGHVNASCFFAIKQGQAAGGRRPGAQLRSASSPQRPDGGGRTTRCPVGESATRTTRARPAGKEEHGHAIYSPRLTPTPAGPAVSRPDLEAARGQKSGSGGWRGDARKRRPAFVLVFLFPAGGSERMREPARAGRSADPSPPRGATRAAGQVADHRCARSG